MPPPFTPSAPITDWLSTAGSHIVDSAGRTVILRGFHWFGMEVNLYPAMLAPNGQNINGKFVVLCAGRPYKTITYQGPNDPIFQPNLVPGTPQEGLLDGMKRLGFNCVRLSICEDVTWPRARVPALGGARSINGWLNPDLLDGSKPLTFNNSNFIPAIALLDKIVDHCRAIGLYAVLDIHSCAPQALYNTSASTHGLWYTTATPDAPGTGVTNTADQIGTAGDPRNERQWIDALVFLAQRYAGNPAVSFDLMNEPFAATWDDNPRTGWPAAVERCASAMQAVNPRALIMVEGIFGSLHYDGGTEFSTYSGILSGVADRPVRLPVPNKVVYSPHDYPVYNAPRWHAPDYPASLTRFWDRVWGNLGVPIFIGEFGGDFRDPAALSDVTQPGFIQSARQEARLDRAWIGALTDYIKRHGASWCYFAVNQTGTGPTASEANFIEGLVEYRDWATPLQETLTQLQPLLAP
jgi:aryl-phospho-beta-D-glucosidase BglC (GH1 family)